MNLRHFVVNILENRGCLSACLLFFFFFLAAKIPPNEESAYPRLAVQLQLEGISHPNKKPASCGGRQIVKNRSAREACKSTAARVNLRVRILIDRPGANLSQTRKVHISGSRLNLRGRFGAEPPASDMHCPRFTPNLPHSEGKFERPFFALFAGLIYASQIRTFTAAQTNLHEARFLLG